MAQARKATKVNSKINMLLYGAPFSGKTTLGMQLAMLHTKDGRPFRLLVLDGEQGGADDMLEQIEANGVNLDNIYIVYTQSLNEVQDYIRKASKREDFYELDDNGDETENVVLDADGQPFHPDAILLDGSSVLRLTSQQSLLNLARRRAKIKASDNGLTGERKLLAIDDVALSPREWGALAYSGQGLVLDLAASGLHWVITAREKEVTETRYINGKTETVFTGQYTFDSFKSIDYNSKTVARLYRDEEEPDVVRMSVSKDRTGVFAIGQIVDSPSLLAFQQIIDRSSDTDFIAKNTMENAVDIESRLYEKTLGVESDAHESPAKKDEAPSADGIRASIKDRHSHMDNVQRSEFAAKLKSYSLPTSIKSTDDIAVLNRILSAADEVLGKN